MSRTIATTTPTAPNDAPQSPTRTAATRSHAPASRIRRPRIHVHLRHTATRAATAFAALGLVALAIVPQADAYQVSQKNTVGPLGTIHKVYAGNNGLPYLTMPAVSVGTTPGFTSGKQVIGEYYYVQVYTSSGWAIYSDASGPVEGLLASATVGPNSVVNFKSYTRPVDLWGASFRVFLGFEWRNAYTGSVIGQEMVYFDQAGDYSSTAKNIDTTAGWATFNWS
jgi:hypothetical protein